VLVLTFFPGPEFADLHPARVLAHGLSTFILQRFVLSRSLFLPPLSVPSSPCIAPVVQQSPRGPFYFVPSCAFFPCSCPCICPTHSLSFSCPSHGDNGNARLRFFTAGSGGTSTPGENDTSYNKRLAEETKQKARAKEEQGD
jgi:hypothetical protein